LENKAIFVTGATGFIGRQLVADLLKENVSVYALIRENSNRSNMDKRIHFIKGDITENIVLPSGIKTIYHCAGIISRRDQMENVNVHGSQNIVDAALKQNCRLIHLSSAGVVGRTRENYIDENTECNPQNLYEQTKLEAEKIVKKGIAMGLKAQILRPTIVFGTGREPANDSFLQLIIAMKSGRYKNIGAGSSVYNIVHVNEVVHAMRALDSDDISNGGIYFINTPITFKEMYRIVQEETKGKVNKPSSIPYSIAFGAAAILSAISLIAGKKMPLTLSRLKALTNKKVFSQNCLIDMTSYRPLVTVEDYIRQACREYAEKGLLN
jgi:nucleoside-diphosphate-sugar epimerase